MIQKAYEPLEVEEKWIKFWESSNYFRASNDKTGECFSIVIPPPNVTGVLHLGHALNNTLQDILTRYQRMNGKITLWLPGTDHAGIATQNVVEKSLREKGITKEQLGREKFIEKVWEWKEKYGNTIIKQLKRLGASCDWSRLRFTMDEGLSKAVKEVFVRLYKEGLIYKGEYLINWCPRCGTALSDIEVEHIEVAGNLYYIKYPLIGSKKFIVVATTRPETMLGDTAVAVNPEDERYKDFAGKKLLLPLMNREIPVIFDSYVDMEFGTGALKVTPAHDPNDFEMYHRHSDIDIVNIFTPKATLNKNAGKFAGFDRYEARKAVIEELKKEGFLLKIEDYTHKVGHCYRCDTVIEPFLSKQWFVKVKPLAEPAIKVVKQEKIKFYPERWAKTYFNWMENIKDWCISRQLWWGHRIPVFYCQNCNAENVEINDPEKCSKCGSTDLIQDEDVLDTWFSSALWPFSTLGWPEETEDLKLFYPTSVLSTGFDIIFFWVARMIMMGLKFMNDVPFKDVYIHALIRDEHGEKMSKSRGNVIDPLEIIQEFGADSLRFTLTALAVQGRDICFSKDRVKGYKRFLNKLYNATRFIKMNIPELKFIKPDKTSLSLADKFVLTHLLNTVKEVRINIENYQFSHAAMKLYSFVWDIFCDWYIEISKIYLKGEYGEKPKKSTQNLLLFVLDKILKLLHPFIPFITEELWADFKNKDADCLAVATYPVEADLLAYKDESALENMAFLIELIKKIRLRRWQANLPPSNLKNIFIKGTDSELITLIKNHEKLIKSLARVENINYQAEIAAHLTCVSTTPLEVYIDLSKEEKEFAVKRLKKELEKITKEYERDRKKLLNQKFINNAKPFVVKKVKQRVEQFESELKNIKSELNTLEGTK